ncbi:MAG: UDP-N-acetylmuramate dehydrogenase [bacterium]
MFKENVNLKDLSSFHVGGSTRWFTEDKSVDEIIESLQKARKELIPVRIVGEGTNILWSDERYNGLVLRPTIMTTVRDGTALTVGAGVKMANVIDFAIQHGLSGLEWAGGLPGSVGGALRGNAGAFCGEMQNSVSEILSIDVETYGIRRRDRAACKYEYRNSVFKKNNGKEIIIEATLYMRHGDKKHIRDTVEEKILFRKNRHPLEYPTAGSTFKNVPIERFSKDILETVKHVIKTDPFPIIPAGYLIEHAGMKGYRCGGAMISEKHSNFIINISNATAVDIRNIIIQVKEKVFHVFNVHLEEEIIIF